MALCPAARVRDLACHGGPRGRAFRTTVQARTLTDSSDGHHMELRGTRSAHSYAYLGAAGTGTRFGLII